MAKRSAQRNRKKNDSVVIAGAGLAALAFLFIGKNQDSTKATPSIIVNPPTVSIPGFQFTYPNFFPGNLGGGGTTIVNNTTQSGENGFGEALGMFEKKVEELTDAVNKLNKPEIPSATTPVVDTSGVNETLNQLNQFTKAPAAFGGLSAIAKDVVLRSGFEQGKSGTNFIYTTFPKDKDLQTIGVVGQVAQGGVVTDLGKRALLGEFENIGSGIAAKTIGGASRGLGVVAIGFGTLFAAGALNEALEQQQKNPSPENAGTVGAAVGQLGSTPAALIPGLGPVAKVLIGAPLAATGYVTGYSFQSVRDYRNSENFVSSPFAFTSNNVFSGQGFRAVPAVSESVSNTSAPETTISSEEPSSIVVGAMANNDSRNRRTTTTFGFATQTYSYTPGNAPDRYAQALIRLRRGGFK